MTSVGAVVILSPDELEEEIAEIFSPFGKKAWSSHPRTYAVLRLVNRIDALTTSTPGTIRYIFPVHREHNSRRSKEPKRSGKTLGSSASCTFDSSHDGERWRWPTPTLSGRRRRSFSVNQEIGKRWIWGIWPCLEPAQFEWMSLKRMRRGRNFTWTKKPYYSLKEGFKRLSDFLIGIWWHISEAIHILNKLR